MTVRTFLRRQAATAHPWLRRRLVDGKTGRLALMYHSVRSPSDELVSPYSISSERFDRQLAYLDDIATFVTPEEFLSEEPYEGLSVLVTFDDGYVDNRSQALSVLERYDAPAAVFLTSRLIDADLDTYLDWDGVRALESEDLITIGSHSRNHVTLTSLDQSDVTREVHKSRRHIEARIDGDVNLFSYPNGGYSAEITETVADAGYTAAFADRMRATGPNDDRFAIGRLGVAAPTAGIEPFVTALAATDPIQQVR